MQAQITLSSLERQHQIVQYLQRRQRATVLELAGHFAISEATVRRDLETLSEQGEVERFHGGARMGSVAPPELPVLKRQSDESSAKAAIGLAAAALVQDGESIFISSGTTALQVAQHLRQRQGLTVITNSMLVINALRDLPSLTV